MSKFYTIRDMDITHQRVYVQGINDAWDTFKYLVNCVILSDGKYDITNLEDIMEVEPAWSIIKDAEDFQRELEKRKRKAFRESMDYCDGHTGIIES